MLQNPDKLKMRNLLITLRDPEMINDKDNFYPGQVKNGLVISCNNNIHVFILALLCIV